MKLSSTLVIAVFLLPGVCSISTVQAENPNVLFIIADDLGIGDLACYGNPWIDTPTIDGLAAAGVQLTDHYAPSPLCAPSRAGFLTGRFNHRTGAVDVPSNRGLDRIALAERTFGDHFRAAGYRTALIGKWHNGLYCRDYLPHQRGFDLFYGFPNGGQDYWKWNLMQNDHPLAHDGRYLTEALNDKTIEFIRESNQQRQPFAIFLAHHAPHPPFRAPDELIQKYKRQLGVNTTDTVATIYAMIEALDRDLERVFTELKENDCWDNTIVVFTSDNGAYLGGPASASTRRFHAGYSGNKGDVGEQGIRVPAIVTWPEHIAPGSVLSVPIHGCDWLPTLLAACGQSPQHNSQFDGKNVLALLRGENSNQLNERLLPFQKNRYRPVCYSDAAIREGRWKLVWPSVAATMKKNSTRDNPSYRRGLIHPHWEMPLDRELAKAPKFINPKPRLYDLSDDPGEQNDLASQHPNLVKRLSGAYDDWFADVIKDWRKSRKQILAHDQQYWKNKDAPDARQLFDNFWLWNQAPAGTDRTKANPLSVFDGYWSNN